MEKEHLATTNGYCLHSLDPELLAEIAPVCAAARLDVVSVGERQRRSGQPRAAFYSLDSLPAEPGQDTTYLVGRHQQISELYHHASMLEAHVVIVPDASQWLFSILSEEKASAAAQVTVVSGSTGGAGASAVATLCGIRAAGQGHRVLLVDGTSYPTPHVGIGNMLISHATHDAGWDQILELDELPIADNLRDHLSQQEFGDGRLWWITARQIRQVLPVAQLAALLSRYRHHFDHIIIDGGTADRAKTLAADRYLLVTWMTDQADAACYFLENSETEWQLVLNGAPGRDWTPDRFAQTSGHPVLGRIKPFTVNSRTLRKVAMRRSLAFLDTGAPVPVGTAPNIGKP